MGLPNLFMTPFYKRAPYWRACDQIWRNSATLAEVYKSFTNFWQFISCWQNAEPTLANLWHYWANFHLICCIWPNNEKYSNHLVTLNQTVEKSRHIFVCFDGKKWLKIKLWSKINKIVLQHFQIIKSGETNFGIKIWERERERDASSFKDCHLIDPHLLKLYQNFNFRFCLLCTICWDGWNFTITIMVYFNRQINLHRHV